MSLLCPPPSPTTTTFPQPNHALTEGMVCEKGIQILLTTVGAFAAFGLMTVAIGTDYWLYSRALICNSTANVTQDDPHNKDKKDPGALTHSGLWRICCLEGKKLPKTPRESSGLAPFASVVRHLDVGQQRCRDFRPGKKSQIKYFDKIYAESAKINGHRHKKKKNMHKHFNTKFNPT